MRAHKIDSLSLDDVIVDVNAAHHVVESIECRIRMITFLLTPNSPGPLNIPPDDPFHMF